MLWTEEGMVGNKRGKKGKKRECGYVCGGEKKRGKKEKEKKGRRAHVCGEKKKEIISQYFHNIFTINLMVGYY